MCNTNPEDIYLSCLQQILFTRSQASFEQFLAEHQNTLSRLPAFNKEIQALLKKQDRREDPLHFFESLQENVKLASILLAKIDDLPVNLYTSDEVQNFIIKIKNEPLLDLIEKNISEFQKLLALIKKRIEKDKLHKKSNFEEEVRKKSEHERYKQYKSWKSFKDRVKTLHYFWLIFCFFAPMFFNVIFRETSSVIYIVFIGLLGFLGGWLFLISYQIIYRYNFSIWWFSWPILFSLSLLILLGTKGLLIGLLLGFAFGYLSEKYKITLNKERKYYDNNDDTVTDKSTGLMWKKYHEGYEKNSSGYSWTYLCENYNTKKEFSYYSDWRLPTQEELITLIDLTKGSPSIDQSIFPRTPSAFFWCDEGQWLIDFGHKQNIFTRILFLKTPKKLLSLNFNTKDSTTFISRKNHIRLVRTGEK